MPLTFPDHPIIPTEVAFFDDPERPSNAVMCDECKGTGLLPSTWVDDEQPNTLCFVCDGCGYVTPDEE